MKATQKGFEEKYHQKFFNSYGFANSYSLIVTKRQLKIPFKHGLRFENMPKIYV